MKLQDFLSEAYETIEERRRESALKYALKYLSYVDEGNERLQTEDVLRYGEERKEKLTGEEFLEEGNYLLWSIAHDGVEWLLRFKTYEEAVKEKKNIDDIKFSTMDNCFIKVVKSL